MALKIMILALIGISLAPSLAWALVPLPTCQDKYESCISSCCASCGSTTGLDANGDLVCNIGTADNVNQQCLNACMPCSNQYQQCMQEQGTQGDNTTPGSNGSCCSAIVFLIGLVGVTSVFKRRSEEQI
jgi:hypothetical protein